MSEKLTKAQTATLRRIARITERAPSAHKDKIGARLDVLERLRERGLIDSARPFAGLFHRVTLTEAGKKALEERGS